MLLKFLFLQYSVEILLAVVVPVEQKMEAKSKFCCVSFIASIYRTVLDRFEFSWKILIQIFVFYFFFFLEMSNKSPQCF